MRQATTSPAAASRRPATGGSRRRRVLEVGIPSLRRQVLALHCQPLLRRRVRLLRRAAVRVRVRVRVRVHVRRRVLCVSVLLAGRQPASCRTSTRLPPRLVARLG